MRSKNLCSCHCEHYGWTTVTGSYAYGRPMWILLKCAGCGIFWCVEY